VRPARINRCRGGFGEQRGRRGGVPMDEFGAEFDRYRQSRLMMGPDASADPLACIQDERRDVRAPARLRLSGLRRRR
jgi:hypothetical protein